MKTKLTLVAVAILATLALAPAANAQTAGLTSFTGGSTFGSFNGTDMTIGWTFTTNKDITVTSLGFYDASPSTPLAQDHEVGLWNSSGTLLTSADVSTTDPIDSNFRYATNVAAELTSGSTYYIGALISSPFTDLYVTSASSVTVDSALTFDGTARSGTSGSLEFPSITTSGNGRFGPNFLFTATSAATPEPGSVALFVGMMTVGAGVLRKRRK